jgi:hypothetical protein
MVETIRFPVTTLASGHALAITAHLVRSPRPGPSVALVSGLHGDEFFAAAFFRDVLGRLETKQDQNRQRRLGGTARGTIPSDVLTKAARRARPWPNTSVAPPPPGFPADLAGVLVCAPSAAALAW